MTIERTPTSSLPLPTRLRSAPVGGTIEPEVLHALAKRVRLGTVAAGALAVLLVVGFVLTMGGTIPAAAGAVGITAIFAVGAWATATAITSRMQLAVGRSHGWRRETCEVTQEGFGRWARVVVRIPPHLVLQAVDGMSNSVKLLGQTSLEVAGDPSGRLLLRIPGTTKLYLFKEPRSAWEL